MATTDPLLAIDRSLTAGERAQALAYVRDHWPRLVGAQVADVLEHTTDYDMFLDQTEPFFEAHTGELSEAPNTAALHTLILLGRELTVANVAKVLLAAGLLPKAAPALAWRLVIRGPGAVTGYQAESARWHYLTGRKDGGAGHYLTRWTRGGLSHLDDLMEACRNVTDVSTPDEGRRLAQLFEAGEDIPECGPAWCGPGRPGLVTS